MTRSQRVEYLLCGEPSEDTLSSRIFTIPFRISSGMFTFLTSQEEEGQREGQSRGQGPGVRVRWVPGESGIHLSPPLGKWGPRPCHSPGPTRPVTPRLLGKDTTYRAVDLDVKVKRGVNLSRNGC